MVKDLNPAIRNQRHIPVSIPENILLIINSRERHIVIKNAFYEISCCYYFAAMYHKFSKLLIVLQKTKQFWQHCEQSSHNTDVAI